MLRNIILVAVAAFSLAGVAQAADVITVNGTPADTWHYGTGNDYVPANTRVLTTDAGDELDLRFHQTFVVAPAAVGNTYSFALGTSPISFDWGFDHNGSLEGITASMTVARLGGTSFMYNVLFAGNDNSVANGSTQNSARLNWFLPDFNANVDSTYQATLVVNGLAGGSKTVSAFAQLGNGYVSPVPEPATWGMMLMGFGAIGAVLRNKRRTALALTT